MRFQMIMCTKKKTVDIFIEYGDKGKRNKRKRKMRKNELIQQIMFIVLEIVGRLMC